MRKISFLPRRLSRPSSKLAALGVASAIVFVTSFALASYAVGSPGPPALPSDMPISATPVVSLSDAQATRLNDSLGTGSIDFVGITPDSYRNLREADVGGETMYVIPGSNGVCVSLGKAASCVPTTVLPASHMVTLLTTGDGDEEWYGGGVTDGTVKNVTITLGGISHTFAVDTNGTFVVPKGSGLVVDPTSKTFQAPKLSAQG